ncbi:MAG: hypothetical protein J6Y28_03925 [Acholeplasmatales bacterium]|nr:hypothetical protein [Acholeplasmatales bacterium]
MKKNDVSLFIIGLFYGIIGIIFLTVPADTILKFIFIVLGILLIIFNGLILLDCIPRIKKDKSYIVVMAVCIIQIILGCFIAITENNTLLIITGSLLIGFSMIDVLSAKDKKEQLKLEATKISLGLIFIILGATDTAKLLFIVLGIISLVFAIIYLLLALILSFIKDEIDSDENSIYKNGRLIASNYDERDKK